MVEKYGEHFENREKLFDHARHNGSNYLYGHCFVSIMLSIPVHQFPSFQKVKVLINRKNQRRIHFLRIYGSSRKRPKIIHAK